MDYAANVETAPDPSVRKEVYSQEMDAAYDIVFTLWLQSKELKVSCDVTTKHYLTQNALPMSLLYTKRKVMSKAS